MLLSCLAIVFLLGMIVAFSMAIGVTVWWAICRLYSRIFSIATRDL